MKNQKRFSANSQSTIEHLLGDFNDKVGRENIFKPTIGNESLHAISIIMESE
jgi:hypothetical protein